MTKTFKEIQVRLANLNSSQKELVEGLGKYKISLIPKKVTAGSYVNAVRLFQLGKYEKSVLAFSAMLKQNPPSFLKDNIHFGLANALYKQKKWKAAEKHFNIIVEEYPFGNKWPASYVMLGLLYSKRDEISKALYILDKAQTKFLSDDMREMIQRLRNSMQK